MKYIGKQQKIALSTCYTYNVPCNILINYN